MGERREGRRKRDRDGCNRSAVPYTRELVHTNFLIPPCSLASGCVTGAYAAHCIYRVCVSSSPLPHSRRPLPARTRHPRCTLYVYLSQKIVSFIYTSFFNRSRIKREAEGTEGEKESKRKSPRSLTMARQTQAVFQLLGRLSIYQKQGIRISRK